MKSRIFLTLFLFLTSVASAALQAKTVQGLLHPEHLRCEYLTDPLGIDAVTPALSWYSTSNRRDESQTAYRIIVATSIRNLDKNDGDLWDSGRINSDKSLNIEYGGRQLRSGEYCFWKVKVWDSHGKESAWSKPAEWSMGLLHKSDWKGYWVGLDSAVGSDNLNGPHRKLSARYLRRQFNVPHEIKRATAYICGLGYFDLYMNGKKIGKQVLSPALAQYNVRSYYMTFDVTKDLVKGENAIGVILGNGRFFAPRLKVPTKTETYGFPKMLFQLNIEYADGKTQSVVSDTNWRITADGPIRSNNVYDGEIFDARKEMPGWDKAGFVSSHWMRARKVSDPSENISAQMEQPNEVMQTLKPKSVKELRRGVYIYDMGQNMVGWASLKVRAKRGTKITMRFAENLLPDGELDTANLRSARQTDVYIADGHGLESWQPRFVYHGFRYVELKGYPGKPGPGAITGEVVYDNIKTIGHFSCSSDIINKIYDAAYWGIRGNYSSIPTDCPQRDERQGWEGDRATSSYGETYIFDNDRVYATWLRDIADAQKPDGSLPDLAPAYWPFYNNSMTWPGVIIMVPNHLYYQFGDIGVIRRRYDTMKKWLSFMQDSFMKDYLLPKDVYGDWCMPPVNRKLIHTKDTTRITPGNYIGSVYFYHCLKLMHEYADLLHKPADAKRYMDLARKVRTAINDTYLNKEHLYYANNTVTANALALYFGIPPQKIRRKVFGNLVDQTVNKYDYHTSCGLVGEQWIMRTLTDCGRPDIALRFAENTTYPSWGYMIKNGATTIWELWDGNTANQGMDSRNHVMLLGDLVVWLYQDLGGIAPDPEHPGYKHIIMKPYPVGNLTYVSASHISPYGKISSDWRLDKKLFTWDVSIPANTTATVLVPAKKESEVKVDGRTPSGVAGVTFVKFERGRAVYRVGSGSYRFVSSGGRIQPEESK